MTDDRDTEMEGQQPENYGGEEGGSDEEAFIDLDEMGPDGVAREGDDGEGEEGGQQVTLKDDSFQAFFSHNDSVYTVAVHPEGKAVLSGGGDDTAYLFNVSDGEEIYKFEGHTDSVAAAAFSHDGKLAATASLDATVKIWDVASGRLTATLDGPDGGLEWVQWHPKGPVVLAGSEDCMVWMWNAADEGTMMMCFTGHSDNVTCGGFSGDGKLVCSGGGAKDNTARIWNPKTGQANFVMSGHGFHTDGLNVLRCHPVPDQPIMATGGLDAQTILTNITNGRVVGALSGAHTDSVEDVAFCVSQPFIATGCLDKKMVVWDLHTGTPRSQCMHDSGVIRVLWHPTEPLVYTASVDGKVRMWDGRTGAMAKLWEGHRDACLDLAVSADGTFIVSSSDDKTVLLFKDE